MGKPLRFAAASPQRASPWPLVPRAIIDKIVNNI
jgi:hypothetical protein